ncbi:MAG: NAD-binding protein, partial [Paramuribaculum sp.]|nr:NAD-binding protein [Paramuribaculum sp.]
HKLDTLDSHYNLMTLNGSTSSFETMRQAGIHNADLYIAVTPFETRNITSCAIAKKLGVRKTVARIDNYEFMERSHAEFFSRMGVNQLIYPEYLAAKEIMTSLERTWGTYLV